MALRIANKINRQIVQNISRSISAKRDADLEPAVQKVDDVSNSADASPPPPPPAQTVSVQYEVCRPRTTPITPFPNTVQNETDAVRQTVALQHLQPAMLPEYYKPPVEINSACLGVDPVTESEMQETSRYRKIEESNTFKNITLPLKAPKLASPFPDPVKVMQSHTVSDQEKAEQMLADSKMARATASNSQPQKKPSIRSLPPARSYSTNNNQGASGGSSTDKKCKIGKEKEGKKCAKIKVPYCAPVKSIRCGKRKKPPAPCVKKQAPYPSYSETCHEDPQNKPSECKICPYRPDEHPTFTPPKNSFHTFSILSTKVKAERMKNRRLDDKKKELRRQSTYACDEDITLLTEYHNTSSEQPPCSQQERGQNASGDASSKSKVQRSTYSSDAKGTPETREIEEKVEKTKVSKAIRSQGANKASVISLNGEMGKWLRHLKPEDVLLPSSGRMHEISFAADEEKPEGGGCKKFPFKECTFEIVKERKPSTAVTNKCPPKPKRKLVKDCPAEKSDRCKRTQSKLGNPFGMLLDSAGKKDDGQKKKCPRVNLGVCKDYRDEQDDPCKRKRTGKTLICPDDLLSKKPRNKKKKTKSVTVPIPLSPPPAGRSTVSATRLNARINH